MITPGIAQRMGLLLISVSSAVFLDFLPEDQDKGPGEKTQTPAGQDFEQMLLQYTPEELQNIRKAMDEILKTDKALRVGGVEGERAWEYFEKKRAVKWIARYMNLRDWKDQALAPRAATALGRTGDVAAVPILIHALTEDIATFGDSLGMGEFASTRADYQAEIVRSLEKLLKTDLVDEDALFEDHAEAGPEEMKKFVRELSEVANKAAGAFEKKDKERKASQK